MALNTVIHSFTIGYRFLAIKTVKRNLSIKLIFSQVVSLKVCRFIELLTNVFQGPCSITFWHTFRFHKNFFSLLFLGFILLTTYEYCPWNREDNPGCPKKERWNTRFHPYPIADFSGFVLASLCWSPDVNVLYKSQTHKQVIIELTWKMQ